MEISRIFPCLKPLKKCSSMNWFSRNDPWTPRALCISLHGILAYILFISSKWVGIFELNFENFVKGSLEKFLHSLLKIWNICVCATHDYPLKHTIYKFHDIITVGNLHWGYHLVNGVLNYVIEFVTLPYVATLYDEQILTWKFNLHTSY